MAVNKQLVNYHINRLKDKNPQVRMNSIEELKHLNDADALQPLEDLYKNDPDADVRKAAQEAGRTIFLANRT
jgi:HEAT repeat protein